MMQMRLVLGLVLFFLGVGYLFAPHVILGINKTMRERVFRDSIVLLHNRRVGIYLVLTSFILLLLTLKGHG